MLIYNIQFNITGKNIASAYPKAYNVELTSHKNILLIEKPKGLEQLAEVNGQYLHVDQNENVFFELKENPILTDLYRRCNYCHVLEVSDVYELQNIAEQITKERQDEFSIDCIINFLESMAIIHIGDKEDENDVYNFSFSDYIRNELI